MKRISARERLEAEESRKRYVENARAMKHCRHCGCCTVLDLPCPCQGPKVPMSELSETAVPDPMSDEQRESIQREVRRRYWN